MTDEYNDNTQATDLFQLLHRAEQRAKTLFANEARGLDLTLRQVAILKAVSEGGTVMQAEIVQRTGIDRSTITELVGRMVRRGLIERHRNRRDARAYLVSITDLGASKLEAATGASQRALGAFIDAVPQDERECFVRGLNAAAGLEEQQNG